MACEVCGKESGKYPLCKECFQKRENGEVIKCNKCNRWHYANMPCPNEIVKEDNGNYLYMPKASLLTKTEYAYFECIKKILPPEYVLHMQANLASFVVRTDSSHFQNELYRNVDFLITDLKYKPLAIIEINDQSHLTQKRYDRDEKVSKICEEAGIPIIKLWTSYGINPNYIESRIKETLYSLPVKRIHHFSINDKIEAPVLQERKSKKKGCYIATCVYGSYDCPEVWVLRRFRDNILDKNLLGRFFIDIYYSLSPLFIKAFGNCKRLKNIIKIILDKFVNKLKANGFEDSKYYD